jgi:Protein of unknown function (DUF998)
MAAWAVARRVTSGRWSAVDRSWMTEAMSRRIVTPQAGAPSGSSATITGTRALLACGVVAGPLFVAVALIQAFTRDGFDLSRHPLSLLSLGELGWIQITNFVVAGLLSVAFAVGLWRVLHPGRGGRWGPLLIGGYGVGLIMGGAFVADAGAGFPPGAPAGAPEQLSWHGILHDTGHLLAFLSLVLACFVFARRFAALGQRGWATSCVATGVALLGLMAWPDRDTVLVQLAVAIVLGWAWLSVLAARLLTRLPEATSSINSSTAPAQGQPDQTGTGTPDG